MTKKELINNIIMLNMCGKFSHKLTDSDIETISKLTVKKIVSRQWLLIQGYIKIAINIDDYNFNVLDNIRKQAVYGYPYDKTFFELLDINKRLYDNI